MRALRHAACLVLASALLGAAPAYAASTLSATIDPAQGGTTASPLPVDTKLTVDVAKGASGHAAKPLHALALALPAEFLSQLDRYEVCTRDKVAGSGAGGPARVCPPGSILGTGGITAWLPQLLTGGTTKEGSVVNLGGGKVVLWWHLTQPVELTGVIDGVVSREDGPVVTWDFVPYARGDPAAGASVSIDRLHVELLRGAAEATAPAPPPAKSACVRAAERIKHRGKRSAARKRCARIASCDRRARKLKNPGKRAAAKRRCRKPAKRRSSTPRAATPRQAPQRAPFATSGCASGSWGFQARLTFSDGSRENADARVACSATQPPPSGGGPVPIPLCPPVCAFHDLALVRSPTPATLLEG